MSEITTAAIGLISGVAGAGLTVVVTRWLGKRYDDLAAVQKYSKPIWLACNDLRHRLGRILDKLMARDGDAGTVLNWRSNGGEKDVGWMNGHGYFMVSTAYLLSALSSWFYIVERKLVFLPFGEQSESLEFFQLVRKVKEDLTTKTPLWFYYLAGVGQMLLDKEESQPITYGQFVLKLVSDEEFREYFDQLFNGFIQSLGEGKLTDAVIKTVGNLQKVEEFLQRNAGVPAELKMTNGTT